MLTETASQQAARAISVSTMLLLLFVFPVPAWDDDGLVSGTATARRFQNNLGKDRP